MAPLRAAASTAPQGPADAPGHAATARAPRNSKVSVRAASSANPVAIAGSRSVRTSGGRVSVRDRPSSDRRLTVRIGRPFRTPPRRVCWSVATRTAFVVVALVAVGPTAARASGGGDRPAGFTLTAGFGLNVDTPFVEIQAGRRFTCARHFELFLDYSYDRPISTFSFQTLGIGARTHVARLGPVELFHQALAAFAVSSSGTGPVTGRDLGERLLGGFLTQGVGLATTRPGRWTVALVVSTGYPVWLRPELTVQHTF